ncbi:uncharacterized protein LOC113309820 [Papaver somniferum]|uniref:uncharacterized protein LOC113309820 n=1 Tax=Papaver somniferum TaxID=3469 RepID=UPI000E6F82EF|nr:uncharacterized protein LOC113309820 [Papaver somniferum]
MDTLKSYATRIKGLQKKIREFSTLVDVDACMIVYGGPSRGGGNHRPVRPDTYPENLGDVIRIVQRYLSLPKQKRTERHKQLSEDDGKSTIEDDNLNESVSMEDDTVDGLEWDDRFDKLSADQIQQLIDSVEPKIGTIDEKIQSIEGAERHRSDITAKVPELGATATIPTGGNTFMQMQPIYVLQPFNQNLVNNGSAMLPMGMINGSVAANGAYPMVMQYPMMVVRPSGDSNQEDYGNHQGQVAYFMPQAFAQPMTTTTYIPNLMPGGTPSNAKQY